MATKASASGSDGIPDYNTVFIDTSLDTHLITVVSPSETVSDLKKKLLYEHALCFPHIGEIKINGLKVKRRGNFYYLSESMLVKSVFHGVNKNWFIAVDASSLGVIDGNRNFIDRLTHNLLPPAGTLNNALDNRPLPKSTDNLALLPKKQIESCDQHTGLDVAGGDGLRSMEMGLKLMEDSCGVAKPIDASGASCPSIPEKDDHYEKENEIENTVKGLESISEGGICGKHGSIPLDERGAEILPFEEDNRKRKRKVASEELNAEVPETGMHRLEKETGIQGSSLGNANGIVSCFDDAIDEPITNSTSEAANLDSRTIVQRLATQSEKASEVEKVVELNNAESRENGVNVVRDQLLENNPQLEPPAKRRRTIKLANEGDEDLQKDDGTLVSESNKAMLEHSTFSQKSLIDEQPRRNVTFDGSSNGTPEAVLKSASPSNKRGRKKKSGKTSNQEASAVPSSIPNEEVEQLGMPNNSSLGEKPAAALATGQHVQDVTRSEPSALNGINPKHKQVDTAEDSNLRPCSLETGTKHKEVSNLEDERETSGVVIESDVKRKRVSKDHHSILAEDDSCAEVQASRHGNGIHINYQNHSFNQKDGTEEDQNHVSDQNGRVSEERDFAQVCETVVSSEKFKISAHDDLQLKANETVEGSKPLGAGVNVDPPKSSKKRKKSKKTVDLASVTPSMSVTEHVKGFISSTSPAEQNKCAKSDNPINTLRKEESDREMDTMSTSSLATEKEIGDVNRKDGVEEDQNHVSVQNGRVNEERDFAHKFTRETASSEKLKLSAHDDDLQLKAKETAVGSKPPGADVNVVPPKPSKKKKKSKKTMDLGSVPPSKSVTEHVKGFISSTSPTEENKSAKSDHLINTLRKEENDSLAEVGREMDTMSTSSMATDKEIGDVNQGDGVEERQNLVSGQNGRVNEERNFAQEFSRETASSEKFKLSAHDDDLQLKAKETAVGTKPPGDDVNVDSPKSSKKRKKSKKTMDLAGATPSASVNEHVKGFTSSTSPTEQNKFAKSDHPINTLCKEDSDRLPEAERDMDTMSTSFLATDKEINDVIQNVVDSVQQMGEDRVETESLHGKLRKKSRKKQNSDAKVFPESTKQIENIVKNNAEHTGYSSELTKHPIGSLRECEKDSTPKKDQGIHSALPMTQKPERNSNKRFPVAVVSSNQSRSGRSNEVTGDVEVSCESSGVNFNDYFAPKKLDLETVGSGETPVRKTINANGELGTVKPTKKMKIKKHDANSDGPSPDFKTPPILNNNRGVGAKPQKASPAEVQISFTKPNMEKTELQSNKKPPKPSDRGGERSALVSSKPYKLNSVPEEARRSNNAKPFESINDSKSKRAESNLKSSKNSSFLKPAVNGYQSLEHQNHKDGKRAPAVKKAEVVSSLKKGRSLVGLSGSIFNDDSDEASSSEDNDSDASTRTPSDVSLSSDYSDGESNAVSSSWKREDGGRKTTANPFSSEMTLDKILRSSFSYKKAKLTASQSQLEDTESQPIDFFSEKQT